MLKQQIWFTIWLAFSSRNFQKKLFSIVDNLVLMLPAPTISFGIESVNNCYEKISIKEIQLDKVIKPL